VPKSKPKAQGSEASGTQASKPKRRPKSKKVTSDQAPPPPGTTKVTDKSQSVSLVHMTTPKDPEGNIQPAGRGATFTFPANVSGTSQLESQGGAAPKYSIGQHQPVGTGGLNISLIPKDATEAHLSVFEGVIGDKDSEGLKPPTDMEPTPPHGVAHTSQTDPEDQTDKTQSVGFEGSGSNHN
jgi:hypothetical protein